MKNHNIYNGGIADVWYSGSRADLWVEYKFIVIPKRPDTLIKIELSELQKNWLKTRFAEGRSVAVVVGSKDGGVLYNDDSWGKNITADDFRKDVKSRAALAQTIASFCTGA